MRVCHLGKYYAPAFGGIETYVRELAHAQANAGMDVEVVCFQHEEAATTSFVDGGVRVTRVRRALRLLDLDWCPDLPRVLKSIRADLLHVHVPNPVMILAVRALGIHRRVPIIVSYHSDHVRQRVRGALFRPVENAFYPTVKRIIANSDAYAAASPLLTKYRRSVTVIPYGIDLTPYASPDSEVLREAEAIRAKYPGPLWLFSGRLVGYKGLARAVHAMSRAPGTLLVAGDGPERDRIQAEVAGAGLRDRVVFLGAVPSLAPYYRAATALWLPSNSRAESFGIVQIEAMASGCPVINTAVPGSGIGFVSLHGESGLTVPAGDVEALAEAATRLAGDPKLRERLSRGAALRAHEKFAIETTLHQCQRVYDLALDRAEAVPPLTAAPAAKDSGAQACIRAL